MLGSAAFRASVVPGGALAGPWVRNELWCRARAVPSLDLRFADNKSLTDAVTGQSLVTFTRASSGTYVDSTGTLRTATTNLLLQSEDFSTTWSATRASVTANVIAAPNGTPTADKLVEDSTATNTHFVRQTYSVVSGTTYTLTVFAKAAERTEVNLQLTTGFSTTSHRVDLSTGSTIGTTGSPVATSVEPVPNGWYRISITQVANLTTTVSQINIFISVGGTTTYTGDGASGIYLWGAQLEQSSTVGEYIPTTSTINSAPRFDHNPTTGESLGLLVEEQRTNLLSRSEEFDTSWVRFGTTTLTTNTVTAPNGTLTADNIVFTSASAGIYQAVAGLASTAYTFSIWIKSSSSTQVRIVINTNLSDPVIQTVTVTSAWQRFNISKTTSAGTNSVTAQVQDNGSGGTQFDLWGAQLETGAFPTSYIPTTTAAATRSADVASITGTNFSSWYRQDEGTVFAELAVTQPNVGGNQFVFRTGDNTYNNAIALNIPGSAQLSTASGGVFDGSAVSVASLVANVTSKTASAYLSDNLGISLNGATAVIDTSATIPLGLTRADIGSDHIGLNRVKAGTIKRLCFWPQRLANSTLQAITQ